MASAATGEAGAPSATDGFGWSTMVMAFLGGGLLVWVIQEQTPAHLQLAVCLLTALAWMCSRVDASVVALLGATGLAAAALATPEATVAPLAPLGHDTTVLIIAAFILAKAVERSGLARTVADRLTGERPRGAYTRLAGGIFATTFLIPSTAARASVLVPLVDRAKARTGDARQRRAIALMAPLVVVLGAFASPVAAGANLLAIQMLAAHSGTELSFTGWAVLALPFALVMVVSAVLAAWLTTRGDGVPAPRAPHPGEPASVAAAPGGAQWRVAAVLLLVVGLWSTTAWHPLDPMLIAVIAAVLVTLPDVGALSLKDGLASVDWSLIVLLTAATTIGDGFANNPLVGDGVAHLTRLIAAVDGPLTAPLVLAALTLTAMLSHLAITSRSARAALLLPAGFALGSAAGIDLTIIALTIASATGFCILTPVGSKAIVIFAGSSPEDVSRRALVRAGLTLLPVQFALTLLAALVFWPAVLGNA